MSYGCELLFTVETAAKVREDITRATGKPCPCEVGRRCPLLPDDLTPLLQVRVSTPRQSLP